MQTVTGSMPAERPGRYAKQLASHWATRGPVTQEDGATVLRWTTGQVIRMRAEQDHLAIEVEVADDADPAQFARGRQDAPRAVRAARRAARRLGRVSGPQPAAYFVRVAPGRFRPTGHTAGAWSETEQHISPLAGLVVHEIERYAAATSGADGRVVSRVSFDILGVVAIEEFEIEVTTVRPGRTVELVEAVVTSGPRTVLVARAWRLATPDTAAVAGGWRRRSRSRCRPGR